MTNRLIILIGGSGTGKTTTQDEIVRRGLASPIISYTSREIRKNETPDLDYHFVSTEEILKMEKANHIVITEDWHYAVSPESLKSNKDMVYSVINVKPALELREYALKLGLEVITVFFNISKEIRTEKMVLRGEEPESVKIRLNREDTLESSIAQGLIPDYVETVMDSEMQERVIGVLWKQN